MWFIEHWFNLFSWSNATWNIYLSTAKGAKVSEPYYYKSIRYFEEYLKTLTSRKLISLNVEGPLEFHLIHILWGQFEGAGPTNKWGQGQVYGSRVQNKGSRGHPPPPTPLLRPPDYYAPTYLYSGNSMAFLGNKLQNAR